MTESKRIAGKLFVIGTPYLWLGLFLLVPFILVLKISFSESILAQPPYGPLWETDASGASSIAASTDNYSYLVEDSFYDDAYLKSVKTAFVATVIALLIGYPDRVRHRARKAAMAKHTADAGGAAVLDLVSDPCVRVEGDPAGKRTIERIR